MDTQAQRIISRFGGPRRLAEALASVGRPRDPASVYRWLYPKDKGGTGGNVPTKAQTDIRRAARYWGIVIRPEDWEPTTEQGSIFE